MVLINGGSSKCYSPRAPPYPKNRVRWLRIVRTPQICGGSLSAGPPKKARVSRIHCQRRKEQQNALHILFADLICTDFPVQFVHIWELVGRTYSVIGTAGLLPCRPRQYFSSLVYTGQVMRTRFNPRIRHSGATAVDAVKGGKSCGLDDTGRHLESYASRLATRHP